jgi:hypothetical protein
MKSTSTSWLEAILALAIGAALAAFCPGAESPLTITGPALMAPGATATLTVGGITTDLDKPLIEAVQALDAVQSRIDAPPAALTHVSRRAAILLDPLRLELELLVTAADPGVYVVVVGAHGPECRLGTHRLVVSGSPKPTPDPQPDPTPPPDPDPLPPPIKPTHLYIIFESRDATRAHADVWDAKGWKDSARKLGMVAEAYDVDSVRPRNLPAVQAAEKAGLPAVVALDANAYPFAQEKMPVTKAAMEALVKRYGGSK